MPQLHIMVVKYTYYLAELLAQAVSFHSAVFTYEHLLHSHAIQTLAVAVHDTQQVRSSLSCLCHQT